MDVSHPYHPAETWLTLIVSPNATFGDPTFSNCATQGEASNGACYRAWGHHMSGSSNVIIHGSALWVFFNGMDDDMFQNANCDGQGGVCQSNTAYVSNATKTFWYSLSSKSTKNLVYDATEGKENVATQQDNPGGWGAVIAAYLRDSGISNL